MYAEDSEEAYAVDDASLPEMTDLSPTASEEVNAVLTPPLARAAEWMTCRGVLLPSGKVRIRENDAPEQLEVNGQTYRTRGFRRDPNTMPNWAGSCWYYLRYFDPHNSRSFVDPVIEKYWSQESNGAVDLYVGGTEHAVPHLLYSRFWHKVLYDLDLVSTPEPFQKLFNQGMITADAYRDERASIWTCTTSDGAWRAIERFPSTRRPERI